jgi:hypothetical protein
MSVLRQVAPYVEGDEEENEIHQRGGGTCWEMGRCVAATAWQAASAVGSLMVDGEMEMFWWNLFKSLSLRAKLMVIGVLSRRGRLHHRDGVWDQLALAKRCRRCWRLVLFCDAVPARQEGARGVGREG